MMLQAVKNLVNAFEACLARVSHKSVWQKRLQRVSNRRVPQQEPYSRSGSKNRLNMFEKLVYLSQEYT